MLCRYTLKAAFIEIYNESVRDLLGKVLFAAASDLVSFSPHFFFRSQDKEASLDIKHERGSQRVYVADLTMVAVDSEDTVTRLLHSALNARATAATRCNERSSRSHCVFQLFITGSNSITGQTVEGTLNLIDLAGSERVSNSGATGDRFKETVCHPVNQWQSAREFGFVLCNPFDY